MGDDKKVEREIEAPFNMAIATLQRLDIILQQIKNLDLIYPDQSLTKQKSYMNLVKQFYINAIPLFPKEEKEGVEKLNKKIFSMKIRTRVFILSGTQKRGEIYDTSLSIELDETLIDIQRKLKKFFMPSKRAAEGLI